MTRLVWRAVLAVAMLLAATASGAEASSITVEGHFTQHFGMPDGELAPCPNDELICGTGLVAGYGRATNAFIFGPNDEFLHAFTLADGSTLTAQLEFAAGSVPGKSRPTPGGLVSVGNPETLEFDAQVIDGTGRFAGAVGSGNVTLRQAGNVDQITVSLEVEIP